MIDNCVFMKGMINAPFDREKCEECGGTGYVGLTCCSGIDCGCRALPTEFVDCECGCEQPSDSQIEEWANKECGYDSRTDDSDQRLVRLVGAAIDEPNLELPKEGTLAQRLLNEIEHFREMAADKALTAEKIVYDAFPDL